MAPIALQMQEYLKIGSFIINITVEINFSSKVYSKVYLPMVALLWHLINRKHGERWSTIGYTIHYKHYERSLLKK